MGVSSPSRPVPPPRPELVLGNQLRALLDSFEALAMLGVVVVFHTLPAGAFDLALRPGHRWRRDAGLGFEAVRLVGAQVTPV